MKNLDLSDWVILLSTIVGIASAAVGAIILVVIKQSEKSHLKVWRKTLSVGDHVKVSDGAVTFNAQVLQIWEDRMQVISNEMRVSAYPQECIYPLD